MWAHMTEGGVVGSNGGDGGKHGTGLKLEVFVGQDDRGGILGIT
jgi:hypothetical protein